MLSVDADAAVTNSASLTLMPEFSIQSIIMTNGVVAITWSAIAGQSYKLQYKNTLEGTNWSDVPPGLVATGSEASATDFAISSWMVKISFMVRS